MGTLPEILWKPPRLIMRLGRDIRAIDLQIQKQEVCARLHVSSSCLIVGDPAGARRDTVAGTRAI
jgi:hypothetical protein